MNLLNKFFGKADGPVNSYADFWGWFIKNEKAFFQIVKDGENIQEEFFDKLSPKLNQLRNDLFYLTGMLDEDTAELMITPEGEIKNIVFVEDFINTAPVIPGWKFTALKPSLDIKDVNIEMGDHVFSNDNIRFYSNDIPDLPDEIDIVLVHDDFNEDNSDLITNGCYIFLDHLLGELNFVSIIDNVKVVGPKDAKEDLIPIDKLNDFLIWRQKEFIEKYESVRHNTENDNYSILEAKLESDNAIIAVINTDLLEWDGKASHPWILHINVKYDGSKNGGMPDDETYEALNDLENVILQDLKDFDGYLNIGRQTAENIREIYFACKEFRKPSLVIDQISTENADKFEISFEIYKDKYWQSFNRFIKY